jgi:L-threonylcarbamoyladenylate synthase
MRVSLDEAVDRLRRGEVVAIPTETVYGLAAPLQNTDAIERIFELKERPMDNPLIIHLADSTDLETYAMDLPSGADELTCAFWPGAFTMVVRVDKGAIPAIARASLPTAAFRIPNHALARSVTRQVGALVAPSANLSGYPSATRPEHVEHDFGPDFPVLDGGPCLVGVESTILAQQGNLWQIVRLGAIPPDAFREVLGYVPMVAAPPPEDLTILCPGQRYRHYAPKAALILGTGSSYRGNPPVVLGFSDRIYAGAQHLVSLGPSTNSEIVSHNLYGALRALDDGGFPVVWVDMDFPQQSLWLTVAERLKRAALPPK